MHRYFCLSLVIFYIVNPRNTLGSGTKPPSFSISDSREHLLVVDIGVSRRSEKEMMQYKDLLRKLTT